MEINSARDLTGFYFGGNETARRPDENLGHISGTFYILTIILSSLLNGAVLFVIHRQQNLQEYMRLLYQILTISDVILAVAWSIWNMIWLSLSDYKTCLNLSMVFLFVYITALWSIMLCLCGVSVNLYLLVTRPLRYHTIVTRKRFFCTLSGAYLLIVLACGMMYPVPDAPFIKTLKNRCQTLQGTQELGSIYMITYGYISFPVGATMLCTITIYIRLLFIARKKSMEVENSVRPRDETGQQHGQPQNGADLQMGGQVERRRGRRFKGLVTILILNSAFCICWIPYLFNIMPMNETFKTILDFFPLSNTWIQPIVYLLTNPEARGLFLNFVRCYRPE